MPPPARRSATQSWRETSPRLRDETTKQGPWNASGACEKGSAIPPIAPARKVTGAIVRRAGTSRRIWVRDRANQPGIRLKALQFQPKTERRGLVLDQVSDIVYFVM